MRFSQFVVALMAGAGLLLLAGARASAGPVYFLVTEYPGQEVHHDSYVLPLQDANDIAHARDLITRGPAAAGAAIAVAQIAAGADGINRNETAPGKPAWSWHVTNFDGFADNTVEILDGWPGFIEQDVAGWIANTNSRIGLWSYTVTRELTGPTPTPVPLPAALSAGAALMVAVGIGVIARHRRIVGQQN
jgi:hypothetical protein